MRLACYFIVLSLHTMAQSTSSIDLIISINSTTSDSQKTKLNAALPFEENINHNNSHMKIIWKGSKTSNGKIKIVGEVLKLEDGIERILGHIDRDLLVNRQNVFSMTNEFGDKVDFLITPQKL